MLTCFAGGGPICIYTPGGYIQISVLLHRMSEEAAVHRTDNAKKSIKIRIVSIKVFSKYFFSLSRLFIASYRSSKESRQSFESCGPGSVQSPGPGGGDLYDTSHVPATPPATPPSDQEKTPASGVQFPSSSSDMATVSSSTEPDMMDTADSSTKMMDTNTVEVKTEQGLVERRAAVHAMAYAQACHAMQTFISRSLPLPFPQVRPRSVIESNRETFPDKM